MIANLKFELDEMKSEQNNLKMDLIQDEELKKLENKPKPTVTNPKAKPDKKIAVPAVAKAVDKKGEHKPLTVKHEFQEKPVAPLITERIVMKPSESEKENAVKKKEDGQVKKVVLQKASTSFDRSKVQNFFSF